MKQARSKLVLRSEVVCTLRAIDKQTLVGVIGAGGVLPRIVGDSVGRICTELDAETNRGCVAAELHTSTCG